MTARTPSTAVSPTAPPGPQPPREPVPAPLASILGEMAAALTEEARHAQKGADWVRIRNGRRLRAGLDRTLYCFDAAATSTGGLTNKQHGRVGDSPLIGAGTYANNESCAVSGTGQGEFFIRSVVAYDICALLQYKRLPLAAAVHEVIHGRLQRLGGEGGVIAVDRDGQIAMDFNSGGMFRAVRDSRCLNDRGIAAQTRCIGNDGHARLRNDEDHKCRHRANGDPLKISTDGLYLVFHEIGVGNLQCAAEDAHQDHQ